MNFEVHDKIVEYLIKLEEWTRDKNEPFNFTNYLSRTEDLHSFINIAYAIGLIEESTRTIINEIIKYHVLQLLNDYKRGKL